jgi:hypothetical protein
LAVYWVLFGYFAVGALLAGSLRGPAEWRPSILYTAGALLMTLLLGLRYQVGGDWSSYEFIYQRAGPLHLLTALSIGDPAYQAVNWLSYQLGGGVWLVNLICAAVFVWGLFRLCRTQPEPWLAVLVAIPYMVIVVGMGYTRQAVALGILMAGIAAVISGASALRFAVYVVAAALFHKTAVVGFPIVALATGRNRLANLLLVIFGGVALYDAFLGDAMDNFVQNYVRAHYSSQGAAIRILMNMVAAGLFTIAGHRLKFSEPERKIWRNFSYASAVALLLLVLVPSSAAVDRISLYLIPLQVAVISRMPNLFKTVTFGTAVTVAYCFSVEFVWLNFAQFAYLWIPYGFFPLA